MANHFSVRSLACTISVECIKNLKVFFFGHMREPHGFVLLAAANGKTVFAPMVQGFTLELGSSF